MSLTKQIEIAPLTCIQPSQGMKICSVDAINITEFPIPSSHETTLVYVAPGTVEDLFVHHFQTDQLVVIKGKAVLAVLQNSQYQYILMSDRNPKVVKIPPGIPHGGINLTAEPCIAVNSVIRHGSAHPRDYRPVREHPPYDLEIVRTLLAI